VVINSPHGKAADANSTNDLLNVTLTIESGTLVVGAAEIVNFFIHKPREEGKKVQKESAIRA